MPWHADDEPEYGDLDDCTIASVSVGAARPFELRSQAGWDAASKQAAKSKVVYLLSHGSLLVMRGATQRYYAHRLPKRMRQQGVSADT